MVNKFESKTGIHPIKLHDFLKFSSKYKKSGLDYSSPLMIQKIKSVSSEISVDLHKTLLH